jgi:nucleotidyltransferase/DNA polymerase involved in DNA repair
VFLGKVASDMQNPDGLTVITAADLPEVLLGLELQEIYGFGACNGAAAAARRPRHRRPALERDAPCALDAKHSIRAPSASPDSRDLPVTL